MTYGGILRDSCELSITERYPYSKAKIGLILRDKLERERDVMYVSNIH